MNKSNRDLKGEVRLGLLWGIINQFAKQIFSFVTTLFLVRLLLPEDFGLLSMVLVFSSLSTILINMGFSTAIVQRPKLKHIELSSIFWLNVTIGLILTIILFVLAPSIGLLYRESKVVPIARAIAILYLMLAIYMVPRSLLEKRLDFKSITIAESSGMVAGSIIALLMAFWGYGVWALVAQLLVRHFWVLIVVWYKTKWKPMFSFKAKAIIEIGQFSKSVFYSSIMYYLSINVDRFLIGKYDSKAAVGLYDKSFSLAGMPKRNMSQLILSVLFSSFARIQNDEKKVKSVYLQAMRFVAFINFPLMIGILLSTRPIVLTLFGDNWESMVPYLRIFAFIHLLRSFDTLFGSIMLAKGKSTLVKRDATYRQGAIILSAIVGIFWGSLGVAYGILMASVFNFFLTLHHARLVVGISPINQLKNIHKTFYASLVMGAGLILINLSEVHNYTQIWQLIINVSLSISLYFGYLYWRQDSTFREMYSMITNKRL